MKVPATGSDAGEAFQRTSYFTALDCLRAVSILLVLLHHVPPLPAGSLWRTLQENGRYGVAFFFAISGFLICTLFLREERRTGRVQLAKFYGRRAVRLLPLYYVVLALQAALVFGAHQYTPENQELFRAKLPAYLAYYANWLPTATAGPFFCAWSLAAEEQFYLVFGLLFVLVRRRALVGVAAGALLLKAAVYAAFGNVDTLSPWWRVIFSYQEAILWGVLLAFALDDCAGRRSLTRWLGSRWLLAGASLAAAVWLVIHPMSGQSSWDAQLLFVLMTAVIAGLVLRPAPPGFGGGLLVHVGRISYGIYLLHMFVISAVKKLPSGTSPVVCLAVSTVVVVLLASVVHRWFERPIIERCKQRLSPALSSPPRPAPPEASSGFPLPAVALPPGHRTK